MNSLLRRLSISLAAVLLAAGALLAVGLQDFPRGLVEDYVLSRLRHDADLLYVRAAEAGPDPAALEAATRGAAGSTYELPLSGHYFLIQRGEQSNRSRSTWDEDVPLPRSAAGTESVTHVPGPAGQRLLALARRYADAPDAPEIVVTVAEDIAAIDGAIAAFRTRMLAGVAFALGVMLILQRRLLVRGLAPLHRAVDACRRLERGEATTLDGDAPAEVQPMIDAVNRLAHHHTQRLGRIRRAAGNLSHALKTPLAVLSQTADEIAAQGDEAHAGELRIHIDAMRSTMERELHRARLAGAGPTREYFEARGQLGALAAALQRLHADKDIAIELDVPDCRFPVDREDMLELFGNLLDNACKWARRHVRVSIDGAVAPGELSCHVDDDGPGVPDDMLHRLGTAGLRADENRPGHGLGLAIVGDIVAQYDGTLHYGRAPALGGLRVSVRLPLADD
ncbi:sensor histidine kinase [Thauera sinica]|uniref:histidine kinase n=2 Tax=Thauera TaxID=33057 RepID=A0ABW1AXB0_9RHOO|nr:histidine kinase [Thauera sp. K11]